MPTDQDQREPAVRPIAPAVKPSATRDADIAGLALIVTTRRAFWCLLYQPRGINPATGKRWGGGVRYELGDAMLVSVSEARGLALGTKAAVRQGRSPHHEAMASRANVEASRSILPITGAEALDAYARALASRSTPSERSRAETLRYARKAVRLMKAEALPLSGIDARMIRLMVETMTGSGRAATLFWRARSLSHMVPQARPRRTQRLRRSRR